MREIEIKLRIRQEEQLKVWGTNLRNGETINAKYFWIFELFPFRRNKKSIYSKVLLYDWENCILSEEELSLDTRDWVIRDKKGNIVIEYDAWFHYTEKDKMVKSWLRQNDLPRNNDYLYGGYAALAKEAILHPILREMIVKKLVQSSLKPILKFEQNILLEKKTLRDLRSIRKFIKNKHNDDDDLYEILYDVIALIENKQDKLIDDLWLLDLWKDPDTKERTSPNKLLTQRLKYVIELMDNRDINENTQKNLIMDFFFKFHFVSNFLFDIYLPKSNLVIKEYKHINWNQFPYIEDGMELLKNNTLRKHIDFMFEKAHKTPSYY